jgi:hypothetical protein
MDIFHFYRTGDCLGDSESDTERHAKMLIEANKKLRKIYGENYELGSIFQPENARVDLLPPGMGSGSYLYTDHPVPGWKPDKSWVLGMGDGMGHRN